MVKTMLAVAILAATLMTPLSAFAQDQSGQTMQSENKMGDTMMKKGDTMKNHKKSKHKRRKNKAHMKSTMTKTSM